MNIYTNVRINIRFTKVMCRFIHINKMHEICNRLSNTIVCIRCVRRYQENYGISYHHQRKPRRNSSELYQSTGQDSRKFICRLPPTDLSTDAFRSDIAVGWLIRGPVCQSISKLADTPPGNSWRTLVNFMSTKRVRFRLKA